jgi:hypothetical protein
LKTQWLLPWVHFKWVKCELLYYPRIGTVSWKRNDYF